jgi:hypothetical protein
MSGKFKYKMIWKYNKYCTEDIHLYKPDVTNGPIHHINSPILKYNVNFNSILILST